MWKLPFAKAFCGGQTVRLFCLEVFNPIFYLYTRGKVMVSHLQSCGCVLYLVFVSLHIHFTPPSVPSTLLDFTYNLPTLSCSSPALAASGGQLPLSSLEGGHSHMLLGGPGGPAVSTSLRSSLFLNRPTLLPMVTASMVTGSTSAMGLVSSGVASSSGGPRLSFSHLPASGASDLMSPTSCPEESPCSSPASFCSFSEASPPPLGGTMAD